MKQEESQKEKSTLNDYHRKRNKEAVEAAKRQSKRYYTSEEMRSVIERSLNT